MEVLPTISIVVPNYNGAKTLAATLDSLIGQGYPKLEIIVIDGGSSDSSMDIVQKYSGSIAYWVSEPDKGQADAINKGFEKAKGEVINWLCSDDLLLPGALLKVGRLFHCSPTVDIVVGSTLMMYLDARAMDYIWRPSWSQLRALPVGAPFGQPSCFFRKSLFSNRRHVLDSRFHYAMDTELWSYLWTSQVKWHLVTDVFSVAVQGAENKTTRGGQKIIDELEKIYQIYCHDRIPLTYWHRRLRHPLEVWYAAHRHPLSRYLIYLPIQVVFILLLSPFYGYRKPRWMNWLDFS